MGADKMHDAKDSGASMEMTKMKKDLPPTLGPTLAKGLAKRMFKEMAASTARIIEAGNRVPVARKPSRYLGKVFQATSKIRSPWKLHGP
jgi:hypothetical protein